MVSSPPAPDKRLSSRVADKRVRVVAAVQVLDADEAVAGGQVSAARAFGQVDGDGTVSVPVGGEVIIAGAAVEHVGSRSTAEVVIVCAAA